MSNSTINKLNSGMGIGIGVTLKLPSNVDAGSNKKTNFSHKLLLPNSQASELRKALANDLSANINLSRYQLYKIGQSGGFPCRF